MRTVRFVACAFVLLGLLSGSCGYRVTAPNSHLPRGIRSVRIPLFQNRTAESNAEALLTQSFRELYMRSGLLDETAEAFIEGTLLGVNNPPVVASSDRGPTYRLTVVVQLRLVSNGQTLSQVVVSQGEDFSSGADVLLTEQNRSAALRRLADVVAREGAERLDAP